MIKSKKSGWRNGLRLELYVGDYDEQQQYGYKAGIRLIVNNQSEIVFSNDNGIDVSVGYQTNIAISRTMVKRKPYPYSNCIEDHLSSKNLQKNPLLQTIVKKYPQMNKYSQNFCIKICHQEFLFKMCECYDLSLPLPSKSSMNNSACESIEDLDCIKNEENFFFESEIEKCYASCPSECFQVNYDLKVSSAKYPTKWYTSILKNSTNFQYLLNQSLLGEEKNIDFLYLQQTMLMVNIFYDQMSYSLIEEQPELSIDALLAFIGGNLGLFLGISVLTVIEIIEFFFYLIYFVIVREKIFNLKKSKVEFLKK